MTGPQAFTWAFDSAKEMQAALRADSRAEKAERALAEADRLASVVHDAIWSNEVRSDAGTGFGILHDSDREDSAQSAIWRLHEVVRAALRPSEEASDLERNTCEN